MTVPKHRITAVSLAQPKKVTKPRIEIDLAEVERLASQGMTMEQIAQGLGISVRTLEYRKKDFADFADAIKKGQAKGVIRATGFLFNAMEKGNLTAIIFYLKTQAGWKETERKEVTGADGKAIELEQNDIRSFTNEQLLEIARMHENFSEADTK